GGAAGDLDRHVHAVGQSRLPRAEPVAGLRVGLFRPRAAEPADYLGDLLRHRLLDAFGDVQLPDGDPVHVRLLRVERDVAEMAGPVVGGVVRAVWLDRFQSGHSLSDTDPGEHAGAGA